MDKVIVKIPLYKSQAEAFVNKPNSVEGRGIGRVISREVKKALEETVHRTVRKYSLFIEYGRGIDITGLGIARLQGRIEKDLRDKHLIPPEVKSPLKFSRIRPNPDIKKNEADITIIVHE